MVGHWYFSFFRDGSASLSDGEKEWKRVHVLRRMKAPFIRLNAEDETACAPAVPELVGTFGGKLNGVYVEWTFHGDGRFTQVTPYDELNENGYFIAGGEEFAILLGGKIFKYPYRMASNYLLLYPSESDRIAFAEKAGPLVQLPSK